jgi:hypothetical protein
MVGAVRAVHEEELPPALGGAAGGEHAPSDLVRHLGDVPVRLFRCVARPRLRRDDDRAAAVGHKAAGAVPTHAEGSSDTKEPYANRSSMSWRRVATEIRSTISRPRS